MKKICILLISILFLSTTIYAKVKVPTAVTDAFNKKFSNVTNVKWEKENKDEYEVSFKLNGDNCSANFTIQGEWLETESTIPFDKLPEKVKNSFNISFKNAKVKSAAKIEKAKAATTYEIEYKLKGKTKEVIMDADGKEIKK